MPVRVAKRVDLKSDFSTGFWDNFSVIDLMQVQVQAAVRSLACDSIPIIINR